MNKTQEDIVDLFSNEISKKEKKEKKKIEKFKKKEEKKKALEEKRLAKIEDKAFALKQKKENEMKKLEDTKNITITSSTPSVSQFLSDTLIGFFSIIILLSSIGYNVYEYLQGSLDIIYGSLLIFVSLTFVLSMVTKNEKVKKVFYVLSSISFALFVCYQLFI